MHTWGEVRYTVKDLSDQWLLGDQMGTVNDSIYTSAEELAASITAWQQDYDQMSAGLFQGGLTEIWLEDTQFFIESSSTALRQSCISWPGAIWFGFTSPFSDSGFVNEYPFNAGDILIQAGGHEFELITPTNFQIIGFVIDQKILKQYLAQQNQSHLFEIWMKTPVFTIPHKILLPLWMRWAERLNRIKHSSSTVFSKESCDVIQDGLFSEFMQLLEHHTNYAPPSISLTNRRKALASVRHYILEQTDRVITITELCNYLHVSRRTLQNYFQEIFGTCPNHYLKNLRLNAVRKTLTTATQHKLCIQNIATQYGFWHLSQFATDYRQLFGELPSETLAKSRKN